MKNSYPHLLSSRLLWLVPILLLGSFISFRATVAQQEENPPPVQTYFVPMPEDQLLNILNTLNDEASSPIETVISVVVGADNTLIYYDHWEDGYELDVANPQQDTTLIWGDGDPSNGSPPGFDNDEINAGSVIVMRNDVSLPRDEETVLFDGGDFLASTKLVAMTRAGWPVNDPGSQLAGATVVYNSDRYGREFIAPVGVDTAGSNNMFEYVGIIVMAGDDGTSVSLTNGDDDESLTLDRGESHLFTDLQQGARLTTSRPVQAYLVTGDINATYEARVFALFSRNQWSDSYYSPVATTAPSAGPAYIYLFNPYNTPLTVQYETAEGEQEPIEVAANDVSRQTVPTGSGTHYFTEDGRQFYAISTIDSDATNNQIYDWGFTLIPARLLSPAALVGWGPGNLDRACNAAGAEHPPANPVWVMATADTDILVDYDGNPNTGENTDANGNKFDQRITVQAFESVQLFDNEEFNGDFDQTGMRIYVIDENNETNVVAVWGQDPARGTLSSLCNLDMGTSILPVPAFVAAKGVAILEGGEDGEANPGDVLQYSVLIRQQGPSEVRGITFQDTLPEHTSYIAGSAEVEGSTVFTPDDSETYPFTEPVELGDLGVDEEFVVRFQVQIDTSLPESVDSIYNQAVIQAQGQQALPEVEIPVIQRIDLAIEKTDDVALAAPGETVVYELVYTNVGSSVASGVFITDTVPVGTFFMAAESTDGWSCDDGAPAGTVCRLSLGVLPADSEPETAVFAVIVDPDLSDGLLVENTAFIGDDGIHGPDVNLDNNQDSEDTPVPVFESAKTFELIDDMDDDGNVDAGDIIRYRIVVNQRGDVTVPDVSVLDALPEFTNYISGTTQLVSPEEMDIPDDVTGTPFPLDNNAFDLGDLAEGETFEIVFDVMIDECFVDRIVNEATITAAGREQIVSVATVLDTGADLALLVTDMPESVVSGRTAVIDLAYVNVGNSDAEDVIITATLPEFVTAVTPTWTCDDNVCTYDIGTVESMSAPGTVTLVVRPSSDIEASSIVIDMKIASISDSKRDPAPGNNLSRVMIDIE